jgi:hypothetical protein
LSGSLEKLEAGPETHHVPVRVPGIPRFLVCAVKFILELAARIERLGQDFLRKVLKRSHALVPLSIAATLVWGVLVGSCPSCLGVLVTAAWCAAASGIFVGVWNQKRILQAEVKHPPVEAHGKPSFEDPAVFFTLTAAFVAGESL